MNNKPHIYILTGPTGAGKTTLAVEIARLWNTEIISADSMQIYRQMCIGTARPTTEELKEIPCRLTGMVNIDEKYDLARFISEADANIKRISNEGHPPFIVGGTGLYIKGLLEGVFPSAPRDDKLRKILKLRIKEQGLEELHKELAEVDPESAERIPPGDRQRIVRALEVYRTTGKPISIHHRENRRSEPRYPFTLVVLTRDRDELYKRIEQRVDKMFSGGLVDEVQSILDAGYSSNLHPLKALGYREMIRALNGECSMEEAVTEMKKSTRRFAKRQLTWFRGMPGAQWLNATGLNQKQLIASALDIYEKNCGE